MGDMINDNPIIDLTQYIKDPENKTRGITEEIEKQIKDDVMEMLIILDKAENNTKEIDYSLLAEKYSEEFCQCVKKIQEEK